jgi:hypothetical protein
MVVSASENKSVSIWSVDNRQEFAMLAFQKNGDEYAAVTLNNRTFGTRNSALGLRRWETDIAVGSRTRRPVYWAWIVILENEE